MESSALKNKKIRLNDIIDEVKSYNSNADISLIQKAYVYSAQVHNGQMRKSGEPYLTHPIAVAYSLAKMQLDTSSICVGLLHDTVEDTLATTEEIQELFGDEISYLVDGVTKLSQISFISQEEKQAENFRKMIVAMSRDIRVLLVKLADRNHNMKTLDFMPPEKQVRIAQETMDIYVPLANRLGIQWLKIELEDIAFRYLHPTDFFDLKKQISFNKTEKENYISEVIDQTKELLNENQLELQVYGRFKNLYSIYKKLKSRQISLKQIYDIIAFRIITENQKDCYQVLGLLHNEYRPVPGRFKDYIAIPKPNGYKSLHTTVIGLGKEKVEFQIRTQEMHRIAEEGIAAHWKYKEGGKLAATGVPDKDSEQFSWLKRLVEWQKDLSDPDEFLETVKIDLFQDAVYCFSPKGDIFELPRGATPIDFAYQIHTEVGNICSGARINGRIVKLNYELRNGDTVEILTAKSQKPNKDWLNVVCSAKAKACIRASLRKENREKSSQIGFDILEKACRTNGLNLKNIQNTPEMEEALAKTNLKTFEDLVIQIAYGKIVASQFLKPWTEKERPPVKENALQKMFSRFMPNLDRKDAAVRIDGCDDLVIQYAKCCNPVPGDNITGYISRGRGIIVHMESCPMIDKLEKERLLPCYWDHKNPISHHVRIKIISINKRGLLADISNIFSKSGADIQEAVCKTNDENATNYFVLKIKDKRQLSDMIQKVESLNGVMNVERVSLD